MLSFGKSFLVAIIVSGISYGQEIGGTIRYLDGAVGAGATVSYSKSPATAINGTGALTGSVSADSGGAFRIAGISAGTYRLCARDPDGVSSCIWSAIAGHRVTVPPNQSVNGIQLTLSRTGVIKFRVDDAAEALAAHPTERLSLLVVTPTGFILKARLAKTEAKAREYTIVVPRGVNNLPLRALHPSLRIHDDQNRELGERKSQVSLSADLSEKIVTLRVGGRK